MVAAKLGFCLLMIAWLAPIRCAAQAPTCAGASLRLTPDFRYLIGSAGFGSAAGEAEAGSTFRWLRNGSTLSAGPVAEGLLLHFDGAATGANGEAPFSTANLQFHSGKWGSALALPGGGLLRFPVAHNLDPQQGTIELWVALREDGTNAAYSARNHTLFLYRAPNGEYLQIAQSSTSGILYAGGTVSNQWESAYGGGGNMRAWRAGEWHHLAFTYSASSNFMRFYVDGALAAANNESHYWPPAGNGAVFAIGGDLSTSGNAAYYWIDECRVSGRVAEAEEIAARFQRDGPGQPNEVWLPAAQLTPGDAIVFEFTPATATAAGQPCQSAALPFVGIPILNAQRPSTLLAAGTTSFDLSVQTAVGTSCAYAIGQPLPFVEMTPFASGAGSTQHQTRVAGLSPDPQRVNDVYVRCSSYPDYVMRLRYRAMSVANPPFPRTGNLWGWSQWRDKGLPYMAKVDLWLGAEPPADEIRELRRLNPHLRLLTSVNAVENSGLPADYYLKDVNGQRIEVWPGSFRLNLTKPYVAEYQAYFAYETVLATDLMADGVFFDNVMTSQSWQSKDMYGNPVQIDSDENGVADDPAIFDAAWKAGVFHEIRAFRQLMPHAIVNGHAMDIYESGIAELFNGISIGFATANVLEGEESFAAVWNRYRDWQERAVAPVGVMIESSPRDQIAYGYSYEPMTKVPPSTLEFARSYYPDVRFGLAFTLMHDGFFAHEYGDTWHGNDWWYDELDFELGYPLGAAQRVEFPDPAGTNGIVNPGFEAAIASPWRLNVNTGCAARLTRQTTDAPEGSACARVDITATTGSDWHIEFAQYSRSLTQGVTYDFSFRARSSAARPITLSAQKGSPDWRGYGLYQKLWLTNAWQEFIVPFTASETVSDARLQFFLGESTNSVWIDGVRLVPHRPDVFRRDFTYGIALLNGTREPREVPLGAGFHRLTGPQAPMIERIIDDIDPTCTFTGAWTNRTYDSGEWTAIGPFYHSWAGSLHERTGGNGAAQWPLPIELDDTYTISAWWPAAPAGTNWTAQARYEIVSGGVVVAATNLNQRLAGDQWNPVATVALAASNTTFVRLTAPAGACVADAIYLRSAARYNNGQSAERVRLQAMDGIVLRRDQPVVIRPRLSQVAVSATNIVFTAIDLTPGLTNELQMSSSSALTDWQVRSSFLATNYGATITDSATNASGFYRLVVP